MQAIIEWLLSIYYALIPLTVIDPWEEGIRVRLGKMNKRVGSGLVWTWWFIDELFTVNVRRQVIDLNNDSIETADRVPMLFSITITYKIRDAAKIFLQVQDHEDSLEADAMTIVSAWMNKTQYEDVTIENLIAACEPDIRKSGFRWGCEVEWMGVMDLAKHRVLRLLLE